METISIFNKFKKEDKPQKQNILIGETVYIVGHKNSDLDSVASAYTYQIYRHSQGDFNYLAIRCCEPNPVTQWVFDQFKTPVPMLVSNISGMKVALVDHTDPTSRPDGWEEAKIVEVLDHHKLNLETAEPSKITIRPYGATATLIGQKMIRQNVPIRPSVAGLLLSAIIDDTLALRSPTTTSEDKFVAGNLSTIAGIDDIRLFARELFDKKDTWDQMKPRDIINLDYKEFNIGQAVVGISQVETMDNKKLEAREKEFIAELQRLNTETPITLRLIMLTDLLRNDCIMLAVGNNTSVLSEIFSAQMTNLNKIYLPGILSRKKQVLPSIIEKGYLL